MSTELHPSLQGTHGWFPMMYHEQQYRAWTSKKRFVALACGRGSGKTELARRRIIRYLPVAKPWPNPSYFYALPTRDQAKRTAWLILKDLVPPKWIKQSWDSDLIIETVFGSRLYVVGLDKPQRIEGSQYDGCVLDESCDIRPGTFDRSVLPALSHKNGWCWRIGVPKRYGVGAPEFKTYFDRGMSGVDPDVESYTWKSDTILSADQLRFARENLSESDFQEQFCASWEKASGLVYGEFSDDNVVDVQYDPNKLVIIGCDFNVDPMCWTFSHRVRDRVLGIDELHTVDEVKLKGVTTQQTLDLVYSRFGSHRAGIQFVGDATSRARKTAAAFSDYVQIQNDTRFINKNVFFPNANPSRLDRYAAVNAMLRNASGIRRWKISPRCKRLILDLRNLAFIVGTREPNVDGIDNGEMGHMSDAAGYVIFAVWPLTPVSEGAARIHA